MGLPPLAVGCIWKKIPVRKVGFPPLAVGCIWKKIPGKEGGLAPAAFIRDIFQAMARKCPIEFSSRKHASS